MTNSERTLKIKEALELEDVTRTYQSIADEFGVSRQRVHQIAKQYDLTVSKGERTDIMISGYIKNHPNYTTDSVCKDLGIFTHTFYKYCKKHSIPTHTAPNINPENVEMYKLMTEKHMNYKDIALKFGISENACMLRIYRYKKYLKDNDNQ